MQATQNTYDLDANLALLRFYQFQPQDCKIDVLAKVLLKALAQLPSSDFKTCLHLLPEQLQVRARHCSWKALLHGPGTLTAGFICPLTSVRIGAQL